MGWQDDPVVDEAPQASGGQSFMDDPVVDDAPQEQAASAPAPSMGDVALNAIPKGIANFLNTPNMINSLALKALAQVPGMENIPGIKELGDRFARNGIMELMKKGGLVDPNKDPQTGPQRIVDMAIQSAIGSAIVPGMGAVNAAKSAAMGAVSGAAAGVTKEATGSDLLAAVVGMATPLAANAVAGAVSNSSKKILLNQTEANTLKAGQKYGLVVEPSAVRGPSSVRESIAGKAALAQETSLKNQPVFNNMAAKYIGLPTDTPLTKSVFDSYKKTIAKPMEEVDQLFTQLKQNNQLPYFPRYHSQSLMDEYREASSNARGLWRAYTTSPIKDPAVLKAAKAADATADGVFKDIEMVAKTAGDPKLVDRLNNAKKLYARVSDVQSATNVGSGNVNAEAIGRMLQDGKPFEGELLDMGRFARAFGRSSKPKEIVPPPGVSGGDMAMGPVIGAATGDVKGGLLALGIPVLREGQRKHLLSDKYQEMLLKQPSRYNVTIPKSAARASSLMTGKTVLDNREASE